MLLPVLLPENQSGELQITEDSVRSVVDAMDILFEPAEYLNGEYTVVGYVIEGMNVVDEIKKGNTDLNGVVEGEPDRMVRVTVE